MSEFDEATISIKVPPAQETVAVPSSRGTKRLATRLVQICVGIGVAIGLAVGGWYSLNHWHGSTKIDDAEAIAEMEGFDPPAVDSERAGENSRSSRKVAGRSANPHDLEGGVMMPELPSAMFSASEPESSQEIWLTGTIEEVDPPGRARVRMQLSGDRDESVILR